MAQSFKGSQQPAQPAPSTQQTRRPSRYDEPECEENQSMLHSGISSNPMQSKTGDREDEDDGEEIISFLESPTARRPSSSNYGNSSKKEK